MNLTYSDQGKGAVLVLLHGFCEHKGIWDKYQEELSAFCRVIAIDLPGFGQNPALQKEISIENMADHVYRLLTDLRLLKYTMVGHSLGGYVTLAFAESYGERLSGIGLFHSTAFADSDEKKINRDKTIQFIKKNGVELFAKSFVAPLFNPSRRDHMQTAIAEVTEMALITPLETIIETTRAMRDRVDRTHVLEDVEIPVLFIIGKSDTAVPLETSLKQCHLPGDSTVRFFEKTGHMGMYEEQEKSLEVLKNFTFYCNKLLEDA